MKAVVCNGGGGLETLSEKSLPKPELRPKDILVRLKATALNPIDFKARTGILGTHERVLGWDGVGVVEELGPEADGRYKVGDEVVFAGDVTRNGTYAELCAVDSRIVGKRPAGLTDAQAAAFPLVSLTAWELLFESMALPVGPQAKPLNVLIINGAGGVGCAAIQLAKQFVEGSTVVATASRAETVEMCKSMGADHVINHRNPLGEELEKLGLNGKIDIALCFVDLDMYYDAMVDATRAGGKLGAVFIADASKVDVSKMFIPKRLSLHFEFMFTRTMVDEFQELQGPILDKVGDALASGKLKSFVTKEWKGLTADNVKAAQELQESGKALGKLAIVF